MKGQVGECQNFCYRGTGGNLGRANIASGRSLTRTIICKRMEQNVPGNSGLTSPPSALDAGMLAWEARLIEGQVKSAGAFALDLFQCTACVSTREAQVPGSCRQLARRTEVCLFKGYAVSEQFCAAQTLSLLSFKLAESLLAPCAPRARRWHRSNAESATTGVYQNMKHRQGGRNVGRLFKPSNLFAHISHNLEEFKTQSISRAASVRRT